MAQHRVVFVRHGQSVFNKMRRMCGWHDTELTEEGREQARAAGRALAARGLAFDLAFSSALVRARDTLAEMLTQMDCPGVEVRHAWQLNETHLGGWTGMYIREFVDKLGEDTYRGLHAGADLDVPAITPENEFYRGIVDNPAYRHQLPKEAVPTGETFSMNMTRSVTFWNETIVPEVRKGRRVVVVSHKLTLKGLMKHLGQLTDQQLAPVEIKNARPFVYEFDDNMKPVRTAQFLKI